MPLFSIIIPCYNQAAWLQETIASIQQQDFKDWEAIIVNDGSTDETAVVAEKFALEDNRIKIVHQQNGGLSAARNAGLTIATGEWLDFLDADDYYLDNCLTEVAKAIASEKADIIQTAYNIVDEDGQLINFKNVHGESGLMLEVVMNGNPGPCQSLFINRAFASKLGEFDSTLRSAEDWDFWLRAAKAGAKRFIVQKPLVAYRQLHNSMSRNAWTMYANTIKVIERRKQNDVRIQTDSEFNIERTIDDKPAIKHRLLQCLGLNIMQGNTEESFQYFKTESQKYQLIYKPSDFALMNSFLSFRHWYRKDDVFRVLKEYPKYYNTFFKKTLFTSDFIDAAFKYVFKFHYNNSNIISFGFVGKILNYLHNRKLKKLFLTEKGY